MFYFCDYKHHYKGDVKDQNCKCLFCSSYTLRLQPFISLIHQAAKKIPHKQSTAGGMKKECVIAKSQLLYNFLNFFCCSDNSWYKDHLESNWKKCNQKMYSIVFSRTATTIGVRGGGLGRAAAPPGLKIFRANSVFQDKRKLLKIPENKKYIFSTMNLGHPLLFRASANSSKLLNVKSIFNTVKNFKATLFFSASATCSKILNDKKYIFNTLKIPGQLCFSGQAQLAQNSECKKYVPYSGKIQGKLFFRASASCSKILNDTNISIQWKIPGQLCFSGQAQVA